MLAFGEHEGGLGRVASVTAFVYVVIYLSFEIMHIYLFDKNKTKTESQCNFDILSNIKQKPVSA